jgi:DNA-binding NarL/FixJ family response regulator
MIRALKRMNPKIKIIALSGMMDPAYLDETPELNMIELMQKPFSTDKLLTSVQKTLRG